MSIACVTPICVTACSTMVGKSMSTVSCLATTMRHRSSGPVRLVFSPGVKGKTLTLAPVLHPGRPLQRSSSMSWTMGGASSWQCDGKGIERARTSTPCQCLALPRFFRSSMTGPPLQTTVDSEFMMLGAAPRQLCCRCALGRPRSAAMLERRSRPSASSRRCRSPDASCSRRPCQNTAQTARMGKRINDRHAALAKPWLCPMAHREYAASDFALTCSVMHISFRSVARKIRVHETGPLW
mmetsp:Transcript_90466/g.269971  ORF Transcript_90466/g.269971 Transcript_90466/m.269971 type:complete len:239 (+) Transcript_90466:88-804(+)